MPAKKRSTRSNSNGNLEQAMTVLINNQAAFISQLVSINARMDERFARIDERSARMERRLARIERVLAEHHQILIDLPEAIREKIGFKARG